MELFKLNAKWYISTLLLLSNLYVANAQLNTIFEEEFVKILGSNGAMQRSPGNHGTHFLEAAEQAAGELSPVLNSLITGNISSFPLSSTSAGVTFDFSSGRPVSVSESLGPIFAETGKTLGKGRINFGFNYTLLQPSRFRGLNIEDIQFAFTHQDVTPNSGEFLGENPNESDILNIILGTNIDASIFAFYLTAGITNNLDISLAIPLINLTIKGEIEAIMNSFTWAALGNANHHFGEEGSGALNPVLEYTNNYNENAAGLGDLAVRLKYGVINNGDLNAALLVDGRIPTGDETNFLGTGEGNVRFLGIISSKQGNFSPHLNLGYDLRLADLDSDEIEFALGFDQKIASGLSFAIDFLGEIDIDDSEKIFLLPGTEVIEDKIYEDFPDDLTVLGTHRREVERSNVSEDIEDHIFNLAAGFRYAPSEQVQLLGNLLVPLNKGGLRPDFATTIGIAVTL